MLAGGQTSERLRASAGVVSAEKDSSAKIMKVIACLRCKCADAMYGDCKGKGSIDNTIWKCQVPTINDAQIDGCIAQIQAP